MKKLLTIFLIMMLSGCATPGKPHQFSKTTSSKYNYEKTWERIIEYFANNNIPIKNVAKDSGIVVAEKIAFSDDYADCGKSGIDNPINKVGIFNVFVKQGEKVSVTVNASFDENRQSGWDGRIYKAACFSTGKIEREILQLVFD